MNRSESLAKFAPAFLKAQQSIVQPIKASSNPYFKSKYANLEAVTESARNALHPNGLSYSQTFEVTPVVPSLTSAEAGTQCSINVCTTILHVSGEFMSGTLTVPVKNPDPQAMGSAITYACRYTLGAFVGIVAEDDDDGEGAMDRTAKDNPAPPVKRGFLKGK